MKKTNFSSNWKCKLLGVVALSMFSVFVPPVAQTGYGVAVAQNSIAKGVVKDAQGEPIVGASVMVKGATQGTVTDIDGNFALSCKPNSVLVISYLGCTTQEVKAGTSVNVVLQEDASNLDEVVVLGYGAQQRKQDLSASVGVVSDPQALAIRPVTSTQGMLQGQLAGVTVQNTSGDPTSTPSLVIRGQGSQNGDNVLWVVDGVPGAPIPSLYDIESIVVLKDAASAAIYGATSGAGGCVLVTTKKASKTKGAQLSYDGTVGFRNAVNTIHGLNALDAYNVLSASRGNSWIASDDAEFNTYLKTQRTDWTDEIYRTAIFQRHNVGLNFGNEIAQNRVSFAYNNDQGVLKSTYSKNFNVHYNGNFNVNKWITITEDLNWKDGNSRGVNYTSDQTGVLLEAIAMPQCAAAYNEDGSYGGTMLQKYADLGYAGMWGDDVNPLRLLESDNQWNRTSNVFSTTTLQIHDILPGLKFTSRYSINVNNYISKSFTYKRTEVGKQQLTNNLNENASRSSQWRTENTLTYDNSFGKHTIGLLLSTTADSYLYRSQNVDGKNLSDESTYLQYIGYASSYSLSDGYDRDTNVAIIARAAYSFDDRYFITASWRRDYAGRLPYEKNHGDFPAVTAAWKVSNEKFWEPIKDAVSLFKIRASWGRVGNLGSIPTMYSAATLSKGNSGDGLIAGTGATTTYGTYIYNGKALNRALTWETSQQFDLGVDLAFLQNRLSLSVDYFNKSTYNLIQTQTTNWPNYIGISAPYVNEGKIKNTGIEVEAGWADKVGKNASYYVKGNFSYLHNEVVETMQNTDGTWAEWIGGGSWGCVGNCYRTCVGGALNQFYLVECKGVIKNDADLAEAQKARANDGVTLQKGDLWFVDQNGDGKIDDNDYTYQGSATPKYTFALSAGFTWKNLSVSAMFQGVAGAQVYYVGKSRIYNDSDGKTSNLCADVVNNWSESNPTSDIPRLATTDPAKNWSTPSTFYLEKGDYLRLKNLTVSYDLTSVLRKCTHLADRGSTFSAYVSGENLFTITSYSGMDPECGGYDTIKYPVSRTISFGVKITY